MKNINLGKVLSIVAVVQGFVGAVQSKFAGQKTGAEKKEAVIESVREALPVVEAAVGRDLVDDAAFNAAISDLIDCEKAVLKARARVQAVIDSVKAAKVAASGEPLDE